MRDLVYRDIRIRNAEKADCSVLANWWNDGSVMAHAGFPLGLGTTPEEIEKKIADNSDERRRRLLIEYKGEPIGEMSFSVHDDLVYKIGINICEPNHQEKGLGRIILSMLIEELFSMGAKRIVLDTNLNNIRAQHVYELLGFRRTAVRKDAWTDQLGKAQTAVDYKLTAESFRSFKA